MNAVVFRIDGKWESIFIPEDKIVLFERWLAGSGSNCWPHEGGWLMRAGVVSVSKG